MRSAVVLGGKTGLLGQALCVALSRRGWSVHAPARDEVDLLDRPGVEGYLARTGATALFNTVAYTKVDQAEDESQDDHGPESHKVCRRQEGEEKGHTHAAGLAPHAHGAVRSPQAGCQNPAGCL